MSRKKAKVEPSRIPPPNPDWRRSPARNVRVWVDPCDQSKGEIDVVEVDAFSLTLAAEHYRLCGVE